MKHYWLSGLIPLFASAFLLACTTTTEKHVVWDEEKPVLRVGTNAEFAPFESLDKDGNLQGFDIDFMNALGQIGGFEVIWQDQPWDGIFQRLQQGENDALIAAIVVNDERLEKMDFTKPYLELRKMILTGKNQPVHKEADLLKVKRVGVVKGQSAEATAISLLGENSRRIVRFDRLDDALAAVSAGRIHALIGDGPVLSHYVNEHAKKNLRLLDMPSQPVQYYAIAIPKGDERSRSRLNEALNQLLESDEFLGIYRRYFVQEADH